MATFDVKLNEQGDPLLSLGRTLTHYQFQYELKEEAVSPIRALLNSVNNFGPAMNAMVDTLTSAWKTRSRDPNEAYELTARFATLSYRAAELFEILSDLTNAMPILKRKTFKDNLAEYNLRLKKARKDWSFVCNKLKHNSNILAPVDQVFDKSGVVVHGFSLVRPIGDDKMEINRDFHKGEENKRSYILTLHELIHGLFNCDRAASHLLIDLKTEKLDAPLPPKEIPVPIGSALRKMSNLQLLAFSEGERRMLDGLQIAGDCLHFKRLQAYVIPEKGRVSIQFTGDGITRSLPVV